MGLFDKFKKNKNFENTPKPNVHNSFEQDLTYLMKKGVEFYRNNEYQKCLEICEMILDVDPLDIEALNLKRTSLNLLDRKKEAVSVANQILEIDENNFHSLGFLACDTFERSIGESIPMFTHLLKIYEQGVNDGNENFTMIEPNLVCQMYYVASRAFTDAYLSKEALHCIDNCLLFSPDNNEFKHTKAVILSDLKQEEKSNKILFELVRDDYQKFVSILGIISNFTKLKNFDEVKKWSDEAEKISTTNYEKLQTLSLKARNAFEFEKDFPKSLELIEEYLLQEPSDTAALMLKMSLMKIFDKPLEAQEIASKIIKIKPYIRNKVEFILNSEFNSL